MLNLLTSACHINYVSSKKIIQESISMSFHENNIPLSKTWFNLLLLSPILIGFVITPFLVMEISFNYYYMEKFFAIFVSGLIGIGILASGKLESFIPFLSWRTFLILLALIVVLLANYIIHKTSPLSFETLQRIIFWSLVVYISSYVHSLPVDDRPLLFIPLLFGASVFIILDLFLFTIIGEKLPGFTFGNPNIAAEYTGFCLSLALGLHTFFKTSKRVFMLDIFSCLATAYIYFTNCRSAYIGVALVIVYLVCVRILSIKTLTRLAIISVVTILSIHLLFEALHDSKTLGTIFKVSSTSVRWNLVRDTLEMIKQNPLGFGLGTYEFNAIPYLDHVRSYLNEQIIFRSPHVEMLRFMAEDGILASILMVLMFGSYAIDNLHKLQKVIRDHPEIPCFALFFFVQFLFQFPLENPFPNFMTALLLGYTIAFIGKKNTRIKEKSKHLVFIVLLGLLSVGVLSKVFSSYISYWHPKRKILNVIAYTIDPSHWAARLNVVRIYLDTNQLIEAEALAREELKERPNNFRAMGYLIQIFLKQNRIAEACHLIHKLDQFFGKNSSFNHLREKVCIKPPV